MKIRVIRKSSMYVRQGEKPPPEEHIDVEIHEDDTKVHWDYNQRTLTLREPSGSVLASFTNVFTFYDERVIITPVAPEVQPAPEA